MSALETTVYRGYVYIFHCFQHTNGIDSWNSSIMCSQLRGCECSWDLAAPSHYLISCSFGINGVQLYSPDREFAGRAHEINQQYELENYALKLLSDLTGVSDINSMKLNYQGLPS